MEKEKKKEKGLLIFYAMIALALVASATYAFVTFTLQGKKENTITGGDLKVTLGEDENGEGDIKLTNAYPITDEVGKNSDTVYNFTLTNTNTIKNADYTIYLDEEELPTADGTDEVAPERIKDDWIKVYLTDDQDSALVEPKAVSALGNQVTRNVTPEDSSKAVQLKGRPLYTGTLAASTQAKFKLRLWISHEADESIMGGIPTGDAGEKTKAKQWAGKISVDITQTKEYAVTVSNTFDKDAVSPNTGVENLSATVFKGGTATIRIKDGEGENVTPTVTCTETIDPKPESGDTTKQATAKVEQVSASDPLDVSNQYYQVVVENVGGHTACTVNWSTGAVEP